MVYSVWLEIKCLEGSQTSWWDARLGCHSVLELLLVTFLVGCLPVSFLLSPPTGSMTRRDCNHHNNVQQHDSLVCMHSSHQDSHLHFNRGASVFSVLWWCCSIDPTRLCYSVGHLEEKKCLAAINISHWSTHYSFLYQPFSISLLFHSSSTLIISRDCCSISVFSRDNSFKMPGPPNRACM